MSATKKKVAVIIGWTPYHRMAAEELISDIVADEIVCYFTKNCITSKQVNCFCCPNHARSVLYKLCNFVMLYLVSIYIKMLLLRGREVVVYAPHGANVLANYLFFHPDVKSRYIYEDGIMNYYDVTGVGKWPNPLMRLMGLSLGMRFVKYDGHLSGFDDVVIDAAYLRNPAFAVGQSRIHKYYQLQTKQKLRLVTSKHSCLFLDQDLSNILNHKELALHRNAAIKWMADHGFEELIYKPHHDFNDFNNLNRKIDIKGIDEAFYNVPAEELVDRLPVNIVVSFFSSALINIKSMYPNIRCISLYTHNPELTCDGKIVHMSELFSRMGVECIRLNNR
jgi:hypothetical protein